MGHDGYLPKDSWYVRSVEVDVPTTGHKYFFPCDAWLGKDKEDGKTCRIFSVDDSKDIAYKPKVGVVRVSILSYVVENGNVRF